MSAESIHSDLSGGSLCHSVKSYKGREAAQRQPNEVVLSDDKQNYEGPIGQDQEHGESEVLSVVSSKEGGMRRLKDNKYLVPRKHRRGLLAQLSLLPEFKDAREYPDKIKKMIVFIIAFSSMMGPMGTSIIFPAIGPITQSFDTTTMMVNVSVGVYSLSIGVFPLWWSSFSEMHGRRTVYIISFALLFAFCIGTALAPNISAFIVLRVLCGAASASVQSVGAGTVSDLFIPEERGKNLGMYYLGALMAPLLSPIISSLLLTRWSWRSTQWFTVILAGINVLLLIFLLPETLRVQDNKNAIAAILLARRNVAVTRVETSNSSNDDDSARSVLGDTTNTSNHLAVANGVENQGKIYNANDKKLDTEAEEEEEEEEENALEINRIMTGASSIRDYDAMNHNIDVGAPQMSRIQTHDTKLELEMRRHDMQRMRTTLEDEISRIETAKSGISNYNYNGSRTKQLQHSIYLYFLRPMKSVYFLKYPPVSLTITFSAISFAVLYFVNMTIEYDYSRPPYNFKPLYVGLLYIPNSVTYIFASIYGGKWVDALLKDYKNKHGILAPEARISWNVVTAVISFPISLLIFGWCLGKKCQWVTPLIGTSLFGYASMMTIGVTVSYLVDSLPGRGATGVALNNLIRQTLAAVATFVTEPMLKGMGTGWAFTMLAFIIIFSSGSLIILKIKGDHWRENYDLKELYDRVE